MIWLMTKCLGVISNVIISLPVNGYYFVSFTTGTVMACKTEVSVVQNIVNGSGVKVIASYRSGKMANSEYKSFQEVIMRIKK